MKIQDLNQKDIDTLEYEISMLESIVENYKINYPSGNDYCKSTEAVISGSKYDTCEGIATLHFKLPEGYNSFGLDNCSDLSKNKLFYNCFSNEYNSNKTVDMVIKVQGLIQKEGAKLKIYLLHTFNTSDCTYTSKTLDPTEKPKTSILDGHPAIPCNKSEK